MTLNEKSAAVPGVYTFTEVVNEACDKLKDSQIKYSIRRIQVMDDRLSDMERELDDFLGGRYGEN